jgi:hypothetical protein
MPALTIEYVILTPSIPGAVGHHGLSGRVYGVDGALGPGTGAAMAAGAS